MNQFTIFLILIVIHLVAFLVFVAFVKFGLKKQLSYGIIAVVGFIVGFLIQIVTYVINASENLEFLVVLVGLLFAGIQVGIFGSVAFIVLYAISKSLYRKMRK